jgi:hypothetical protein
MIDVYATTGTTPFESVYRAVAAVLSFLEAHVRGSR